MMMMMMMMVVVKWNKEGIVYGKREV